MNINFQVASKHAVIDRAQRDEMAQDLVRIIEQDVIPAMRRDGTSMDITSIRTGDAMLFARVQRLAKNGEYYWGYKGETDDETFQIEIFDLRVERTATNVSSSYEPEDGSSLVLSSDIPYYVLQAK